jgi:hypothetical protein
MVFVIHHYQEVKAQNQYSAMNHSHVRFFAHLSLLIPAFLSVLLFRAPTRHNVSRLNYNRQLTLQEKAQFREIDILPFLAALFIALFRYPVPPRD